MNKSPEFILKEPAEPKKKRGRERERERKIGIDKDKKQSCNSKTEVRMVRSAELLI